MSYEYIEYLRLKEKHYRLKVLPPRLQRLLAYRYGFGMAECKSISEAAAFFHLTENYLKAIEKNALATLREGMNDGKII